MADKDKVLEMPEKMNTGDLFNYSEAVKSLVNQKKQEYNDLLNKIALAQVKLSGIEKQCLISQSEHSQRMALEKKKFEQEKGAKLNELANREERIQQNERHQTEREVNLKAREGDTMKLIEERKKIYDERIEFENLKNNAKIELSKTLALQSETQNKVDNAAVKEQQAEKKLKEAEQLNINAQKNFNLSNQKEREVLLQIDNLEKIRKEVQPKLNELKEIEKKNDLVVKLVSQKENEINNKVQQDRELLKQLSEKDAAIKIRSIEIATREEEVLRKELELKSKK